MKKIYKILIGLFCFITISGLVYATVTVASSRKSNKLPWQGTPTGFYDTAHNVGTSYSAESRFSFDSGSVGIGVVLDSITGLYWQSNGTATGDTTWDNAKIYCAGLILGGYSDWRLPTVKELNSIVDYSRTEPSIDITYFTITTTNIGYWSSNTREYNTNYARYVYFRYGSASTNVKTNNYYVRCIR